MSAHADVAVLRWPEDQDTVESLRRERSSRLLLVSAGAPPPAGADIEEDWIRLPASAEDINARLSMLVHRISIARPARTPVIDDGQLVVGDRGIYLSANDEALCRVLVERQGRIAGLDDLMDAPGDRRLTPNSLRVHLTRLRRRVEPLGLTIRSAHGRGYVLEAEAA